MDDGLRIWRSFKLGNLMDLIMLDTRHYDRSITSLGMSSPGLAVCADHQAGTMTISNASTTTPAAR